jgi:hypothetical protein
MRYDETHITEDSYSINCQGNVLDKDELKQYSSEDRYYHGEMVKVPVVIGDFTVQFDIEAKIMLPEPALEIKRIKKNIFLTQCRLVGRTNKVFFAGFVRKNIEYATIDCITEKAICGDIKHCTVHVPFQCAAEIRHMKLAELSLNPPSAQISYFDEKSLGVNLKEQDFISSESFNERVYCELEKSSIYEADIIQDAKPIPGHHMEQEFQCFIEKEVVCLTLKLLQNQQIEAPCSEQEDCEC